MLHSRSNAVPPGQPNPYAPAAVVPSPYAPAPPAALVLRRGFGALASVPEVPPVPFPRHQVPLDTRVWKKIYTEAEHDHVYADLKKIILGKKLLTTAQMNQIRWFVTAPSHSDAEAFVRTWKRQELFSFAMVIGLTVLAALSALWVSTASLVVAGLSLVPIVCTWLARVAGQVNYTWTTFVLTWMGVVLVLRFMFKTPFKYVLLLLWRLLKLAWNAAVSVAGMAWDFLRYMSGFDEVMPAAEPPVTPPTEALPVTPADPCTHFVDMCAFQAVLKEFGGLANLKNVLLLGGTALNSFGASHVYLYDNGTVAPILHSGHRLISPQAQQARIVSKAMLKPVPKVEDFENKYQKGGKRILEEDKKKPQGGERIHEEENQTKAEDEIVTNDNTWAAWFYRGGMWLVNAIAEKVTTHYMNKFGSWLFTKLTGMTRENWANVAPVVFGVMSGTTGAWTVSTPDTTVVGLVWVVVSGVSWKLSDVFLRYILLAPAPAGNPVGAGAALPVVAQPARAG